MTRALMTAASGMKAQQLQVDTIANNIANANTTGYKKSELSFRSLLYQTFREPGSSAGGNLVKPTGLQVGSGTEISGSFKNFKQGEMQPTSGDLDLSIQGPGFFRIRLPNGEVRFSRDGSFRRDGEGQIVSVQGYPLDGAPSIPPDASSIVIGEDGRIDVRTREDQPPSNLGTINLFRFPNPSGLKAQGGNLYSETVSSGASTQVTPGQNGAGILRQHFLERSNVLVVDELVALILAQRNYEVNSRAIRVSDEMLQQVNQLIR